MKNKKFVLTLSFILLAALPYTVWAADRKTTEYTILPVEESVEGDYLVGGDAIDLSGTVGGDAMLAGGEIDYFGNVKGDFLAVGGDIEISGTTGQDVRVLGGNITINGVVDRNLSIAGGNLNFNEDSQVTGSTYAVGGSINTRGIHLGKSTFIGGAVVINGKISGDVVVYTDSLVVRENAEVEGSLTYYSRSDAQISENAQITGQVIHKPVMAKPAFGKEFGTQAKLIFLVLKLLASFIFTFVFWKLFNTKTREALANYDKRFWAKLGWGLVLLIVVPIASVICLVTIVGIPLGLSAMALYSIALYAGCVLGAILFGQLILGFVKYNSLPERFPWLALIVGSIVLAVIAAVPFAGFFLKLIVWLWGFGTIAMLFKKSESSTVR